MTDLLMRTPLLYFVQSFWRDETFSVLLAQKPIWNVFSISLESPLYYILLRVWIQLFGTSEIAVRSLSLLGFSLAVVVVILWGESLFKKHWLSWFLPLLFFFNPMLLYYAFEARPYAWYIAFSVLTMYAYSEKRWRLYAVSAVLGLYTHSYFLLIPVIHAFHFLFLGRTSLRTHTFKRAFREPFLRSLGVSLLIWFPWFIHIAQQFTKLSQTWYYPMTGKIAKSMLASVFLGYEGTPDFLWTHTAYVSLALFGIFLFTVIDKKHRQRNGLYFLITFIPITVIGLISFVKPLFVNRYLIPSTIAEVLLLAFFLERIRSNRFRALTAAIILAGCIWFVFWYPKYNYKLPIRDTVTQIRAIMNPNDVILVDEPLLLYDAKYYAKDAASNVYWYNPDAKPFPWYVGDAIYDPAWEIRDIPPYPLRAFIIHLNGTYDIRYQTPISASKFPRISAETQKP